MKRLLIQIRGIVQGVGFRPFVVREARALGLLGSVQNTAYGVLVDCEGTEEACQRLIARVKAGAPSGAVLFSVSVEEAALRGDRRAFDIFLSDEGQPEAAVSPDLGICADCERELLSKDDRRYRYPFINCTNCGPRFSILDRVPYDRAHTSMAHFVMCENCAREYHDAEDRRFHAQPNACAVCGPALSWLEREGEIACDPMERFHAFIANGKIVAVKGLGGFHLACDPYNEESVALLRRRKYRDEKPFALMARDIAHVRAICEVGECEEEELSSPRCPIVLLKGKEGAAALSKALAPGLNRLGVMLAYTPLHILLAEKNPLLVMTSANLAEAPMPYRDGDIPQLWPLCDAVLTHDRPILRRVDDSVCVFHAGGRQLIRRARGFAPQPLPLEVPGAARVEALAFGGQMKNTFCVLREGRAYLSAHIGDLDYARACDFYEREIPAFLALFGAKPDILVCDMHPDYASTRVAEAYARQFPHTRLIAVQHHRAHFASVLAEHGLEHALGFIFDGTGYGEDGEIWGGEVFLGPMVGAARTGTLRPIRLPGGEAAIHEPWRAALYAVAEACSDEEALSFFAGYPEASSILSIAKRGVLSPFSSGMGRLFDIVAAIAGQGGHAAYEGQAAIWLEQAYDERIEGSYHLEIEKTGPLLVFDWRPAVRDAVRDRLGGANEAVISTRFHRAVIRLVAEVAELFPGVPVALSGGVFQNLRLLEGVTDFLKKQERAVYTNVAVPPNDAGISFGQAAYAAAESAMKEGVV